MKNQQLSIPFGVPEVFGTLFDIIVTFQVLTYNPNPNYENV